MEEEKKYDLVISIVNRGYSDLVVDASREAGARGGTIIYGRGTGVHERDTIMGVSIQPEKELIMTLTSVDKRNDIMENICNKAELDNAGMGICFSLPVSKVRGFSTNSKPAENNEENNNLEETKNKKEETTTDSDKSAVNKEEKSEKTEKNSK